MAVPNLLRTLCRKPLVQAGFVLGAALLVMTLSPSPAPAQYPGGGGGYPGSGSGGSGDPGSGSGGSGDPGSGSEGWKALVNTTPGAYGPNQSPTYDWNGLDVRHTTLPYWGTGGSFKMYGVAYFPDSLIAGGPSGNTLDKVTVGGSSTYKWMWTPPKSPWTLAPDPRFLTTPLIPNPPASPPLHILRSHQCRSAYARAQYADR